MPNLEKNNDAIPRKHLDRQNDRQKDRQTLFCRTLLVTTWGPILSMQKMQTLDANKLDPVLYLSHEGAKFLAY